MDQLINATPLHPLLDELQTLREQACYKHKPPLGVSAANYPPLPSQVFEPEFRFGLPVQTDEFSAKDLISPNAVMGKDKTSEQIDRKYINFNKKQTFGVQNINDPSERSFLLWGNPITYRPFLSLSDRRKLERQQFCASCEANLSKHAPSQRKKVTEQKDHSFFLRWESEEKANPMIPKLSKKIENYPPGGLASIRKDKVAPDLHKKRLTDAINYGDEPTVKDLIQSRLEAMFTKEEIEQAKEKIGL